jgi:DNA repair protein RadD
MASLPAHLSAMVTGDTKKAERERILREFLAQRLKYLVNVAVYTTGFDAPHVDVIAILRATESPGLLQQIIGRGLRLSPAKADCLLLDFAENITRHFPDGDIFAPKVEARAPSSGEPVPVLCPLCGGENMVSARKNDEGFEHDENGYFLDLAGNRIETEYGPMPSHYGRRCTSEQINRDGTHERCGHRWSPKVCAECQHENDIAARRCELCKTELVNPNEKLVIEFRRVKKNPGVPTSDKVLSWRVQKWVSQSGNESLRIDWVTECARFAMWYHDQSSTSQGQQAWGALSRAVFRGHIAPDIDTFMQHMDKATMPSTISAYRPPGTEFWKVKGYNEPLLEEPNP